MIEYRLLINRNKLKSYDMTITLARHNYLDFDYLNTAQYFKNEGRSSVFFMTQIDVHCFN